MNALTLCRLYLFLLAAIVLAGCWTVRIDTDACEQVDADMKRALTTFAAARALGAVLSVAQGTQVDVKPAGVGLSIAPGQVLQPLNELIERFAAIMLAASVAFGIQLLLLNIGAHQVVSVLLSAAVLVWVALRWRRYGSTPRWMQSLVIALLVVRFAMPVVAMANDTIFQVFMGDDYRSALAGIEQSPAAVADNMPEPLGAHEGWIDRIERWWKSLPNLKAGYEVIIKSASDWTAKIVRLIAIFVMQTIVLPLGFLLLAWRLARLAVYGLVPPKPGGGDNLVG